MKKRMNSRRIRLDLAYDGSKFCGWQVQNNQRTVQGDIERALNRLTSESIRLHGSGRTDSGVHADIQVAHFDTENMSIPDSRFREALNSLLKHDIRILKSYQVDSDFHARYDAVLREYKFYLNISEVCHPKNREFSWHLGYSPDITVLNSLAQVLTGTHDFTAFSAAGDPNPVKVRKLYSASFFYENGLLVFKITGNAFLWRMVRSILGTLIMCEKQKYNKDYLRRMVESGDRSMAGTTAPAKGLFLHRVFYKNETVNRYERFDS
jgi:tRNA pseudouridine38-40 synthase